ncbi:MAG TPA: hypothetical protein VN578_14770 [Candidatus Binatia bacterium]|nr:hypothetical protein [Candidatus Binatia bacterium]
MTQLRIIFTLAWLCALSLPLQAQQLPEPEWLEIRPLNDKGGVEYYYDTGTFMATNGVEVSYGDAVLTADQVSGNSTSREVLADGSARIQQGDQIWVSQHLRYNFDTHQIEAAQFRTGQRPIFAAGQGLGADLTNHLYIATNALFTTDDISQPAMKIRARRIKIIPGKRIQASDAVLYVGNVPVFYFPYYSRNLGEHANNLNLTPGYRSLYGPFLLGNYTWYLSDQLDGVVHLDYRQKRGPGVGPDVNYHLGPWGQGTLKYYYTHDNDPNIDGLGVPVPENRQRVYFSYQANPATNFYVKGLARYESDLAVVRDFFENEYRREPQPNSFLEANKFWSNFSLDAYAEPRLNNFLETVERLPDVRLTGYRQQLGASPLYYESESSAGYYRRRFAVNPGTNNPTATNQPLPVIAGLNYEAARADTYHQVVLPETFFGWLNVTPRVGGRFTYYSEASGPGGVTGEEYRGVFNTGAEISFKVSRLWPGVQNQLFEVDGLRHIMEPSANYVFVPAPSTPPRQLPKFDYELPSLRLLPIEYPDYNAIDSVDSQNVIRWGLRNKLQTKRDGQLANLVNWDLYTDWRLQPRPDQTTFADLYSDLTFKPRSWLSLESLTRYDLDSGHFRMSYHTLTLIPNQVWSWSIGHYYLRDDLSSSPTALGPGNNVLTSTLTYRLNENWGWQMSHYFNAGIGRLQEQAYTIFRDLRSWTVALSFITRDNPLGPEDYTVAFTFSLKAYPRYGVGSDVGGPTGLLGR